jgi:NADH-quinone oxidoreductase subunit C
MTSDELQQQPFFQALSALPGAILNFSTDLGEAVLEIAPAQIAPVAAELARQGFERLSGITCVDWYPMDPRFEAVYLFHSIRHNVRVRLKCLLPAEAPEIDSIVSTYRAADWYEREVFDLFGVRFRNHPDLRRILMPNDWEGHPLRKDYPVHGYKYSYRNE